VNFRVWIIDDYQTQLDRALSVVRSAEQESGFTLDTKTSRDFTWPLDIQQRPDLVILDLFDDDQDLAGREVYEKIRAEEKENTYEHKNNIKADSYIILWSAFLGSQEAIDYFEPCSEKDRRLVLCSVKSKVLLKNAVLGCLARMKEEDL